MIAKAINGIMAMKGLNPEERLNLIASYMDRVRDFEIFERSQNGRDRYTVMGEFAKKAGLSLSIDCQSLKAVLEKAITWLIERQKISGGWGWCEDTRLTAEAKNSLVGKIDRTSICLPWDTSLMLISLEDARSIPFQEYSIANKMEDVLRAGRLSLITNQQSDGGWSEIDKIYGLESNAIDTGCAIWALLHAKHLYKKEIGNGVTFLQKLLNKDGGTAVKVGNQSDAKATAISVLIGTAVNSDSQIIRSGVDWLIRNQCDEGDWPAGFLGPINATFYAISALYAHLRRTADSATLPSLKKAIEWYRLQTKLVHQNGLSGWAWENVEETSAAISTLLSTTECIDSAPIQKGMEYLLAKRHPTEFWGCDSTMAILAITRYLNPKTNLRHKLHEFDSRIPDRRDEFDDILKKGNAASSRTLHRTKRRNTSSATPSQTKLADANPRSPRIT